jgi:hypothetical protein
LLTDASAAPTLDVPLRGSGGAPLRLARDGPAACAVLPACRLDLIAPSQQTLRKPPPPSNACASMARRWCAAPGLFAQRQRGGRLADRQRPCSDASQAEMLIRARHAPGWSCTAPIAMHCSNGSPAMNLCLVASLLARGRQLERLSDGMTLLAIACSLAPLFGVAPASPAYALLRALVACSAWRTGRYVSPWMPS